MREFFKDCLKNLEAITGLRQLAFWEMEAAKDQVSAERKVEICISGMVEVCKDYPFIPEEAQKKIIRDQMVKDQKYEALNSRTIHKWLSAASNAYRTHSQFSEDDLLPKDENGQVTDPAPPEVAEKYIKQFQAGLAKVGTNLPTTEQILEDLKQVKRVETGRQKFVIEGVEIYAMSEQEARKAYDATFN